MKDLFQLLGGIAVIVALGGFCFRLFRKAGYERRNSILMAIGMFIPLVNVGIAIYFVSTTWPIELLLSALRVQAGVGTEDDARAALSVATRLELRGEVRAAVATYDQIVRSFEGTEAATDAKASIRSLKSKIGDG